VVAPLEVNEGTTSGARAQSATQRAAVLYKPRLATFNFNFLTHRAKKNIRGVYGEQGLRPAYTGILTRRKEQQAVARFLYQNRMEVVHICHKFINQYCS
jgi:hypothetical protein